MKKYIIIAFVAFLSQSGFSQFQFGVVGSYGLSIGKSESTILGTKSGRKSMEVAFLEHKNIASFGISLRKDFGFLYAEVQPQYRKSAFTLRVQNFLGIDEPMNYIEETSSVFNIPVTGGIKFDKVRVGVGPVFNFQTGQSNGDMTAYNIEEKKRNLQMGFQGKVGYDICKNITASISYEYAFNKVGDDYKYNGKRLPIDSKLDYLTFSIGMHF